MTRLEWSEQALSNLDRLVLTHSLPNDTRERIEASAGPLERFPRIGPEIRMLAGGSLRFLVGPWPWLLIVYVYLEADERVVIVSIEDGRAADSTITAGVSERSPGHRSGSRSSTDCVSRTDLQEGDATALAVEAQDETRPKT